MKEVGLRKNVAGRLPPPVHLGPCQQYDEGLRHCCYNSCLDCRSLFKISSHCSIHLTIVVAWLACTTGVRDLSFTCNCAVELKCCFYPRWSGTLFLYLLHVHLGCPHPSWGAAFNTACAYPNCLWLHLHLHLDWILPGSIIHYALNQLVVLTLIC